MTDLKSLKHAASMQVSATPHFSFFYETILMEKHPEIEVVYFLLAYFSVL